MGKITTEISRRLKPLLYELGLLAARSLHSLALIEASYSKKVLYVILTILKHLKIYKENMDSSKAKGTFI